MMPGIKNRTCSAIASRWSWLSETNLSYAMSAPGNRWQPRKREAAERSTAQSGEMNAPRLTRQTLSHSAGLLLSSRRATLTRVELVRFYSDRSHSPYSQHFASKSNDFVEGQIVEVRRGDHWNTAKVLVVTSDRILIEFKVDPEVQNVNDNDAGAGAGADDVRDGKCYVDDDDNDAGADEVRDGKCYVDDDDDDASVVVNDDGDVDD
eukprot:765269-Hanusia_phi.AAC.11